MFVVIEEVNGMSSTKKSWRYFPWLGRCGEADFWATRRVTKSTNTSRQAA